MMWWIRFCVLLACVASVVVTIILGAGEHKEFAPLAAIVAIFFAAFGIRLGDIIIKRAGRG